MAHNRCVQKNLNISSGGLKSVPPSIYGIIKGVLNEKVNKHGFFKKKTWSFCTGSHNSHHTFELYKIIFT